MQRSPQSQSNHDWMVQQVADHYTSNGHQNVKADHIGYYNGAPPQLGDHIPDVTAMHGTLNLPIICEVETLDAFNTTHTQNQLLAFRRAATQLGGFLHIGLPFQSDLVRAQEIAARWNITVDQWWYGVVA